MQLLFKNLLTWLIVFRISLVHILKGIVWIWPMRRQVCRIMMLSRFNCFVYVDWRVRYGRLQMQIIDFGSTDVFQIQVWLIWAFLWEWAAALIQTSAIQRFLYLQIPRIAINSRLIILDNNEVPPFNSNVLLIPERFRHDMLGLQFLPLHFLFPFNQLMLIRHHLTSSIFINQIVDLFLYVTSLFERLLLRFIEFLSL